MHDQVDHFKILAWSWTNQVCNEHAALAAGAEALKLLMHGRRVVQSDSIVPVYSGFTVKTIIITLFHLPGMFLSRFSQ
jgi:hypothetical protein